MSSNRTKGKKKHYGGNYDKNLRINNSLKNVRVNGMVASPIDFLFEDNHFTATINIPCRLLEGAKLTPRNLSGGNVPYDFSYFALDPAQYPVFDRLTEYFYKIQDTYRLTNRKLICLVKNYVQSLRPDEKGERKPQYYPIETIGYACGLCSDKTLLLGALLERMDYDVAYLSFIQENHAMLGIKSDDFTFRGTSYIPIETTKAYADVGFCLETIRSVPEVIKLGDGHLSYEYQ